MLTYEVREDVFPLAEVFTISRGSRTEARVVTVEVESKGYRGWGEAVPYARYGETVEGVIADIKGFMAGNPEHRRKGLQEAMAPGAARFALDIFAVALAFLALSGIFLIKGRKGLAGRGKWFLAAGAAIPALALWLYL